MSTRSTPALPGRRKAAQPNNLTTILLLVLLFLSSLGEVYFPDVMKLNRMPSRTNWFFLAHALGNTAILLLPSNGESLLSADWRAASLPAILDIASYTQLFAGVALAGAQTKAILYSSSILWSAVLSKVLLRKTLSVWQWCSIVLLFSGLALKSLAGTKASAGLSASTSLLGVGLVLSGCLTHAFVNVRNEALINRGSISAKVLCAVIGIYALTAWFALYAFGLIIPEFHAGQWVVSREHFAFASLAIQDSAEGIPMRSGIAWCGFVISTAVHAGAFFSLLGRVGVVSSGIVKGMTTSSYVLLSGFMFCGVDAGYCLSPRTLASCAICAASVVCYSAATARARARDAGEQLASSVPAESAVEEIVAVPTKNSEEGSLRLRSLAAQDDPLKGA